MHSEIDAAEMRKRRDADADHVAAVPQRVSVNEPASLLLRRDNVSARNFVVVRKKLFESVIEPAAFGGPAGDRRRDALLQNVLRDDRVVGQLHLIDRDGVGLELDRALNGSRHFSSVSPIIPAIRSMLICGKSTSRAHDSAIISQVTDARVRLPRGSHRRSVRYPD